MPLSDTAARSAKPREKAYKLSDEKGLYLQVDPNGSKYWRLKYYFADKERKLCIGCYPEVTLAKAREHHLKLDDYSLTESILASTKNRPSGPPKSPPRVALRRSPGNGSRSSLGGGRKVTVQR